MHFRCGAVRCGAVQCNQSSTVACEVQQNIFERKTFWNTGLLQVPVLRRRWGVERSSRDKR